MANSNNIRLSNVVGKKKLRSVQRSVLNEVAEFLRTSFGPYGSNSVIKAGPEAATGYTKDGHDILSKIKYNGPIESSIIDDLVDITRYVVNTVGDGTTSAIQMANYVFRELINLEERGKYRAFDIIYAFKSIVSEISDAIKNNGHACTLDDIHDIIFTSTNGNHRLTENLYALYENYGMDIYIDLEVALNSEQDLIKQYDGMNLDSGYSDSVYVNRPKAVCEIVNPHIYVFEDPVDTPEMISLLDKIIYNNIYDPYAKAAQADPNDKEEMDNLTPPTPTVIIAPRISRDMSSYIDHLSEFIMKMPMNQKPPIVLITAYNKDDSISDIATLCGAPRIQKYINPEIQAADIKAGRAPTIDNVQDFYGTCQMVSCTKDNTKFIMPSKMYEEDGETYSATFNTLLNWLENELARLKEEDKNSLEIYRIKKRINSLKANLIEYFVGGISIADRDNDKALLEDAIKNCRSAIANGVGYGANIEGYVAVSKLDSNDSEYDDLKQEIISIIKLAYTNTILTLYDGTPALSGIDNDEFLNTIKENGPYNLRTNEYDKTVKSSIMSDVVILEAISKIITLMATSEQFILPSPAYNTYFDVEDI